MGRVFSEVEPVHPDSRSRLSRDRVHLLQFCTSGVGITPCVDPVHGHFAAARHRLRDLVANLACLVRDRTPRCHHAVGRDTGPVLERHHEKRGSPPLLDAGEVLERTPEVRGKAQEHERHR